MYNLRMNTVFLTVISGTTVFVLGQTVQRFLLQPLSNFNEAKAEVHTVLELYANVINTFATGALAEEASQKIREVAVKIEVTYYQIPFVKQLGRLHLFGVVSEKNLTKAFGNLIFMHYHIPREGRSDLSLGRYSDTFILLGINKIGWFAPSQ